MRSLQSNLWPEWSEARKLAHTYAIRCLAHRLRKFGFEDFVNDLDARSLVVLAFMVHEPMASACIRRAIACDPSLAAIIKTPVCPT